MKKDLNKSCTLKFFIFLTFILFYLTTLTGNFLIFTIYGQNSIDNYAKNVPDFANKDILTLTNYLIRPARNDFEKIRAIWIWITNNISYDIEGYFSNNITTYDAESTFKNRKGVCMGYTSLFKQMADIAKVNCVIIMGYVKGFNYYPGKDYKIETNHSWVAFNIDDAWYLADPTWGSGYLDINYNFVKSYEEFYFCPDPEKLIYSHYPEERQWQLLENPVDILTFINLVQLWPIFFKLGLKATSHPFINIRTNKDNFELKFETTYDNIKIITVLTYYDIFEEISRGDINITKENNINKITIFFSLPYKGKFLIYLYCKNPENNKYEIAGRYLVIYE
ncbi:MAG: transglutaminase domain-containing protein [Exilispira sp.]